jgi:chromate transport protein ChrA
MEPTRAESWQFFAFVFIAVITLVFNLINELPRQRGWRFVLKLMTFALFGYLILFNPWVQNLLVSLLGAAKGPER